jgi:hypothetical protein
MNGARMKNLLAATVFCIFFFGLGGCCTASSPPAAHDAGASDTRSNTEDTTLTSAEKAKLDLNVRLLIQRGADDAPGSYESRERSSGEKAFAVLVRLHKDSSPAGSELPIDDSNQVTTGFLTIPEILQAARHEAVVSISTPPPATIYED